GGEGQMAAAQGLLRQVRRRHLARLLRRTRQRKPVLSLQLVYLSSANCPGNLSVFCSGSFSVAIHLGFISHSLGLAVISKARARQGAGIDSMDGRKPGDGWDELGPDGACGTDDNRSSNNGSACPCD